MSTRAAVARPGVLVALAIATTASCAPTLRHDPLPDASVRRAVVDFVDALNRLDTVAMSASFADDISAFVPTVRAGRVDGKVAVARIFATFAAASRARGAQLDIRPEALSVRGMGDAGIASFIARDSVAGTVNRRTFVFRRIDGRWLIVHFHASNVPPGS